MAGVSSRLYVYSYIYAGKDNVLADTLLRNPVSEDEKDHPKQELVMTVK